MTTMTTDFRKLCAELIDALDVADTALLGTDRAKGAKTVRDALNRARAALAEGEAGLSDADGDAHELWALAQLAPDEGIEDGVDRIAQFLARHATPRPIPTQENADVQ